MWHQGRVLFRLCALCLCLVASAAVAGERCQAQLEAALSSADASGLESSGPQGPGSDIERLYRSQGWSLLWHHQGVPTAQARVLMRRLAETDRKGLDPADYDAGRWSGERAAEQGTLAPGDPCASWPADLALSRAALSYVADLRLGRVDPRSLDLHLDVAPKRVDFPAFLAQLARAPDPGVMIDGLEPPFRRYRALLGALQRYRALAMDPRLALPLPWPGRSVQPGDVYPASEELAYRLERLGDLAPEPPQPAPQQIYSDSLVQAVRAFQGRHGLARDGIIGRRTLAALNVKPEARVRQILLTLERWRWLPDDLGHRPVVINVPEFRLYAFEEAAGGGYELAFTMDVIVGKSFLRYQTPVFHGAMSYVVFAPHWNVPYSIVRRELLPRIEKDPDYLTANHFEIVQSYRPSERPLPETPENIGKLSTGELKLRQAPGSDNALGAAKFMFPNDHSVYLHGTPAKGLFFKYQRDFSHGCIRIADPARMAAHVLAQEAGWDRSRVDEVIAAGERLQVSLTKPLSVFVLYGTALVEADGRVLFFRDIYGHDRRLAQALDQRPRGTGG